MDTRTADSKGRVALGKEFANTPVIIKRVSPSEIRVIKARIVPESEAWLWENERALARALDTYARKNNQGIELNGYILQTTVVFYRD